MSGEARAPGGDMRAFLQGLRKRVARTAQRTPLPDTATAELREIADTDDLARCFTAAAAAAGCRVHKVDGQGYLEVVAGILREHDARRVAVEPRRGTALTEERGAALREILEAAGVSAGREHDDETLFTVDAAVTGVTAAIAETGTIICVSGRAAARGASLIPPVHVALLDVSQIVPDLFDYFEELGRAALHPDPRAGDTAWDARSLPANINLITGPSKTADIEGILVTGVHGPGHVHIVLLRGDSAGTPVA